MRILFLAILVFGVSSAFAQGTSVNSSSKAGATGIGTTGDIGQSMTFAPHYEGSERQLYMPNQSGFTNPGSLFVDPGRSIISQVAGFQWSFVESCGESTSASMLENPRHDRVGNKDETGIYATFQPHGQYVTKTPAEEIPVANVKVKSYLPGDKKYFCLGTLFLVTENDEETAMLTDTLAMTDRAKRFIIHKLTGFSVVYMVTGKNGFAFEREVRSEGNGFSVAPQGSGFLGSILLGFGGGFSESATQTGTYERPGMTALLFAPAPRHAKDAVYQPPRNTSKTGDEK